MEGLLVEWADGSCVGTEEGDAVTLDGDELGSLVAVGKVEGDALAEGASLGTPDGDSVGTELGLLEGELLG